MRTILRSMSAVLVLSACGDDASGSDTNGGSTGSTSAASASTSTSTSSSASASSSGTSTTLSSGSGSSTTGGSDSSTSSGADTGSSTTRGTVTCDDEPESPDNGAYESPCAGSELGETCALTCLQGTLSTGDAECLEDGSWSEPECADPFDQDEDGVRRYPWGADLDDDGDGEFTYLLGGDDYDDTDAAVQSLAGNGTFTTGETYALGDNAGPTGVAVGDWDNDGNIDIATTNQNNDTLSIFVGEGDGTFTASQTFDLPKEAGGGRIKPADLDADGNLDLVATFSCRIFAGVGDGTFTDSGAALGNCNYIHIVDANDDDALDAISYTYGGAGQLRSFLAQEDGTFTTVDTEAPNITALAPGFIDGDSTVDVALIEFGERSAQTFLGDGDGSFTLTDTMDDAFLYNQIAVPRDLNGDGSADLLIGDFISDHIALLPGNGSGQLAPAASIVVTGPAADGIFAADLDADGSADIVYAAQVAGFGVAMGTGAGAFGPATPYDVGGGEFGLEGADFNGDGRMDFAVINISSNDLVIMLGG